MIARAWADESFKERLLAEPASVFREYGVEVPPGLAIKMVENTGQAFHLVLPAQASGSEAEPPDSWGKLWAQITAQARQDESFKRRLLSQPAAVLRERLGQEVPPGVTVTVLEDTEELFHCVLPARPPRPEGELAEADLATVAGGAFSPIYSYGNSNWTPN
jgi:hypothetical protein